MGRTWEKQSQGGPLEVSPSETSSLHGNEFASGEGPQAEGTAYAKRPMLLPRILRMTALEVGKEKWSDLFAQDLSQLYWRSKCSPCV